MKSPYLIFVKALASLVGGRYPKHYDSVIKKQIRYLWGVGIPSLAVLAYFRENALTTSLLSVEWASTPAHLGGIVMTLILSVLSWRVASLRRKSIEKHVLETNTEHMLTENTSEAARDAIHLSEYIKTYFALAAITHADILARAIFPFETKAVPLLTYVLFLPSLYYTLILIDMLVPLLVRWGRQHIQNDKDSTVSQSGSKS